MLFVDAAAAESSAPRRRARRRASRSTAARRRASKPGWRRAGARPAPVAAAARVALQHHLFVRHHRRAQGHRAAARHALGARAARRRATATGPDAVTLLSTPLYSNTTLVVFFPTLAFGGCVRADAQVRRRRLPAAGRAAPRHPHHAGAGAVPAPDGAARTSTRTTCRRFRIKFCTSAPFNAALKADVLERWPGGLVEFYGMTEGGGTCILEAHLHPDKLHTVGQPAEGHDIRLIDEDGREVRARRGRRSGRPLGRHDDRLPQPAGEDARGRVVRRPTASASSAPATSAASTTTAS